MPPTKVLFFAADPASADRENPKPRLLLDEDARRTGEKVRAAEHRDALVFEHRWAARPDDLIQALNEVSPDIVHFSGHGGGRGLILVSETGGPQIVSPGAIKALFKAFRGNIRLVMLSACHTLHLAEAVAEVVGVAIGTRGAIPDEAALFFNAAFYRALAFGKSVKAAYDQAHVAALLEGYKEEDLPVLVAAPGVDPAELVLVIPQPAGAGGSEGRSVKQDVRVTGDNNRVMTAGGDMRVGW